MRSFTGGEARQMTEAPISLDAIFREGGECREIDVEYGTKISTDLHILHTGPPPSFFVRPACSPLLSLVLSMEGTSCAARLMPAGHDCAAITRSSGMTKMSKRKIMVRKWSGGWRWNEYRRNWWAPVKNPWEVDDESQLRSRKRNRCCGCLGCVVSWLMLFFKEDLN